MIEEIMNTMEKINYGYLDENENNLFDENDSWYKYLDEKYYLLNPEELMNKKYGICWDQVELERKLFVEKNIKVETYFICIYDGINNPTHTFLTYQDNDKFYWFEHSWNRYKGIHEYNSIKELLLDVKNRFIIDNGNDRDSYTFVYRYSKPNYHLSCSDFYKHCENGVLIELNEPLYFYHVVDKNADLSKGILSLKYMYDHHMFSLFDKYASKYTKRIVDDWNISKYKGKESLTREEIIDALNTFRGEYGTSYIYFFRYPLNKKLGKKIENLLEEKDIYRININSEIIQKSIKDIFYGYFDSNSDNRILDKSYYENISEEEYFSNYDDTIEMNFSKLNHISIAFIKDYCPIEFLEKV